MRTQEIRIGVVMYGGVSLAIYTYGVARELADAVQERSPIYRALKELLASDIAVDIVSGTSAGGVNAILLGRALATGGSLAPCAELWRNKGDLLSLLQEPLEPIAGPDDQRLRALFRSREAYEEELTKALEAIEKTDAQPQKTVAELDVFLTGTDLHGRVWTELDARGREIAVKDHRAVFHLKHRARDGKVRKSAFTGDQRDDRDLRAGLAAIARVTSAFPVAFHPVDFESGGDRSKPEQRYQDLMEKTLRGTWVGKRQFVDGGVLDNKPFSHALKPILFRATDKKVERKILYVDPDPEKFGAMPGEELMPDQIAIAALTSLPRYESVADDLEAIRIHNRRVRVVADLINALRQNPSPLSATDSAIYQAARASGIATAIEAAILEAPTERHYREQQLQAVYREIASRLGEPNKIDFFDVFREQRRHLHVIYSVYEGFAKTKECASERESRILRVLYQQLEKLEIAEMGLRDVVRTATIYNQDLLQNDAPRFVQRLGEMAESVLTVASPNIDAAELHADLKQRSTFVTPTGLRHGLLEAIREETKAALETIAKDDRLLWNAWNEFENIDARIYPLQSSVGVPEMDHLELIRVSPFDVNIETSGYDAGLLPADKISGDALFHFGGFIKRAWRSNDIFWGRLDARSILIDALIDPERLRLLAEGNRLKECVSSALDAIKGWTTHAERERIERSLGDVNALAEQMKALLTTAGAREVFVSAAPDVEEDRALDDGATKHEAHGRRKDLAARLEHLRATEQFEQLEAEGRLALSGLGSESLADVAAPRVLRLASQTAYLLLRMLRHRLERSGVTLDVIRKFFAALERIASVAYVIGRGLELGLSAHVVMMGVLFGALVAGVSIAVLAWSPGDSLLPLFVLLVLYGAFRLTRYVWIKRLRAAIRKPKRGERR